jgi:hypothetical protein
MSASVPLLSVVDTFLAKGISGVRKPVSEDNFIPIQHIPLSQLNIDPKYQRLINLTFVKKAKQFDPVLVKPLSVFKRPESIGGEYFIADGQHVGCLAGVYVKNPDTFTLPCQVQYHPEDYTLQQCVMAEAEYFKKFNFLRSSVGTIAKLRADIQMEVPSALQMLSDLEALGVHVEGIGAEDGDEVFGYAKLKTCVHKYGNTYTKRAIEIHKVHIKSSNWKKPLNGAMVLGLAAAAHFSDNFLGNGKTGKAFDIYLADQISQRSVDDWTRKTAGVIQDVLIVENLVDYFNNGVAFGVIDSPTIGEIRFEKWKDDPIHGKTNSNDENTEN